MINSQDTQILQHGQVYLTNMSNGVKSKSGRSFASGVDCRFRRSDNVFIARWEGLR